LQSFAGRQAVAYRHYNIACCISEVFEDVAT